MKHGYGVQIWPNGNKYEGFWRNNLMHGSGKMIQNTGDIYEGDYKDGKANGRGTYTHSDGTKVFCLELEAGIFLETESRTNNSILAVGLMTSKKEKGRNSGRMAHNTKECIRTERNMERECSSTKTNHPIRAILSTTISKESVRSRRFQFRHSEILGHYLWTDKREYSGQWKNNKMHGKGVFTWSDGRKYDGEYVEDIKHGYGVFSWPDGKEVKGKCNETQNSTRDNG